MEWLGDGYDDTNPRNEEQMKQVADILTSFGAEVIGVQEVENEFALARVVAKMDGYKMSVSKQDGKQRNALIYRDYIKVNDISEYESLNINGHLRNGYVADITKDNYKIKIMVVHLKSTSRFDSTENLRMQSRQDRYQQAKILSIWSDSLMQNGVKELAIIGDFNDYPARKNNQTLQYLLENPNLHFLTSDIKNCKHNKIYVIDNIVVSSTTNKRYIENSAFIYDFNSSLNKSDAEKISDHCPISVALDITQDIDK
jgi:endonuclease/exonuclease/phosphatase family metal-dependent hydrolase